MAWVTKDSTETYNQTPEPQREYTKKEKAANWWHYHWMAVVVAVAQLDKYLDDAYIAHLPQVRIVHGKGTGALRAGIHKHLKRLKYIKEFHLGGFGEGDAGVTIVVFK